ncbi:MAG: VanZ family protein [Anaerolineales bacterium]
MTLDFDALTWLIGIVILAVVLIVLRHHGRSFSYLFCFSIFWVYLLLVLKETIFPVPLPENISALMTKEQITFTVSHINLVPFKYLTFFNTYIVFREIIQNILLTIPFGFGISFVRQFKVRDVLWLAIGVGFVIETMQLAVSLGIGGPYRVVDITDLLLNALGVLIGYGFFRVFAWLYLRMSQRLGIKHTGLFAYIHDVVAS